MTTDGTTDDGTGSSTSSLVEGEGVNAGSADATQESARAPQEGDVLGGGDADAVPTEPDTEDDRDLTGTAPGTGPAEPDFEHGPSGQDSGLME